MCLNAVADVCLAPPHPTPLYSWRSQAAFEQNLGCLCFFPWQSSVDEFRLRGAVTPSPSLPCLSHRELIHFDSGPFSDKISDKAPDSTRCTVSVFFFIYSWLHLLFFHRYRGAATTMNHMMPHEAIWYSLSWKIKILKSVIAWLWLVFELHKQAVRREINLELDQTGSLFFCFFPPSSLNTALQTAPCGRKPLLFVSVLHFTVCRNSGETGCCWSVSFCATAAVN